MKVKHCLCGCGLPVKFNKYREREYVNHHSMRGRKHTEKTKELLSRKFKLRVTDPTKHPAWRGGTRLCLGYTYLYMPDHPHAEKTSGYVKRSVVVACKMIKRDLFSNEVVHHINENRLDDRPENLLVLTRSEHTKLHCLKRAKEKERRRKYDRFKQNKRVK